MPVPQEAQAFGRVPMQALLSPWKPMASAGHRLCTRNILPASGGHSGP